MIVCGGRPIRSTGLSGVSIVEPKYGVSPAGAELLRDDDIGLPGTTAPPRRHGVRTSLEAPQLGGSAE